jgi:hypothetical protein
MDQRHSVEGNDGMSNRGRLCESGDRVAGDVAWEGGVGASRPGVPFEISCQSSSAVQYRGP